METAMIEFGIEENQNIKQEKNLFVCTQNVSFYNNYRDETKKRRSALRCRDKSKIDFKIF